jgi:DNA-binding NarL/FixJ family response regulator
MDPIEVPAPVRIIIVDDHPVAVRGFRDFLESEPEFLLVGVAYDQEEFLELLTTCQADIALIDLRLSIMDTRASGIELIKRAQELAPQLRCIVCSARVEYGQEAIDAGARAYILKNTDMDRLAEVIRDVRQGKCVFAHEVIQQMRQKPPLTNRPEIPLTKREKQVLNEAIKHPGDTRAALAHRLDITEGTLANHLGNIYRKLEVGNRAEAIAKALDWEQDKPAFN